MGKYMKKTKPSGEVAAMESSAAATTVIGVRTRARTLALFQSKQQQQDHSYLELRSRRLEKPPSTPKSNSNPRNDKAKKKEEEVVVLSFFGENVLDAESTDRSYRETTPCSSMIRDPETMGTPCSTTRPSNSRVAACQRSQSSLMHRDIPTSRDIEEFFVGAERLHQQSFAEKYNFDPVKDCPLPGRYEWLILD